MKKIGMVGGVAWPSTVEMYAAICRLSATWHAGKVARGPAPMPEFSIESVNIAHSFARRGLPGDEASWAAFDAYFNTALRRLELAGAEFALIASNTPHNRFTAITAGIGIPVLNIFETVAQACSRASLRDVLILGTQPTLVSPAFAQTLACAGLRGHVPPRDADREALYALILRLQAGQTEGAAMQMAELADRSFTELGIAPGPGRGISLSCTELSLAFGKQQRLLPDFHGHGHHWINTGIVHAHAAFDFALSP